MTLNSGWVGEKSWRETRNKFLPFKFSLTYNKVNKFLHQFTRADFEDKSNFDWKITFRMDWDMGTAPNMERHMITRIRMSESSMQEKKS